MKMVIAHNCEIVDQKDGLDPHMRIALREVVEFPLAYEFGDSFAYETINAWDEGAGSATPEAH